MNAVGPPVGALLAGGAGRRIGGDKAVVELLGRPLLEYPLTALREALGDGDVRVVAKRDTVLPPLRGLAGVWIEPDEPQHPLAGILHALKLARGRPVLAVAGDLPLLTAAVLRSLVECDLEGSTAVIASAGGRLQPLCAVYTPAAARLLLGAVERAARMTEAVEALGARIIDMPDERPFFNVNAPDDLLQAAAMLEAERR